MAVVKASVEQYQAAVEQYRRTYADRNNAVGKSYAEFTSADLAKLPSEDLRRLRSLMHAEKYEITDKLLPRDMSRSEFLRAVLRELARKDQIAYPYNLFPTGDIKLQDRNITVERTPFDVVGAKPAKVTEKVAYVAMRDGFETIVRMNTPGLRLLDDVGSKVGINEGRRYPIDTDVEAFDFGYTIGSMPQYRANNPMRLTFSLGTTPQQTEIVLAEEDKLKAQGGKSAEQIEEIKLKLGRSLIQGSHCTDIDSIFEPGSALSMKEAVMRGFFQARGDARNNLDNSNDRLGMYGDCPSKKRAR